MSAALAAILGALVLLAVLLVIAIATWTGYRNTVDLLRQKADVMVAAAVDQLHVHLDAVEEQARFIADAIEAGAVNTGDVDDLVTLLSGALAATPQITSIAFVDPSLQLIAAEREAPVPVPVFAKLGEDPQWRGILARAAKADRDYWDEVGWRSEYQAAQLSRRAPVHNNGAFVGFVNVEVGIPSLSQIIGGLESDFGMNAFILEGREQVVAHPMTQFGFPNLTRWHPMPLMREVGDPILMSIWDPAARDAQVSELLGAENGHAVKLGDETYVFVYRAENGYGGDWLVGSYLAASDVLKEIERLFHAIIACSVVIAVALLLSVWLGRRISRPVRLLAEQSRRVRQLDFAHTEPVPGSYIRELDEAAAAFNQMVEGLRERQMIRDLFGKYVPHSVIEQLLSDKGKLRPRATDATVMFIDLANFTRLSEGLAPQAIVDTLNAYFSGIGRIIEDHHGMITQFQGDAILAVFNLPLADSEHAHHAVEAALAIRTHVAGQLFNGQRLRCRIGVNSGDVVAGNVGAEDRLSYTVHGDTVNIAARLDDLNKTLGTTLLVSAATVQRLADTRPDLRRVGETAIRGKAVPIDVYEIP